MTIGVRKAIIGTIITGAVVGFGIPTAFWFIATAIDQAFGFMPLTATPALPILSALSVLIGIFWIFWAYSYLYFVGRGLPLEVFGRAPHPTRVLVTTGPYAYTRNPMVFGLLFVLLGVALFQGSISGLALVPVVAAVAILYLVIFEEPGLLKRFGDDYEEYRANVPLLFPRFTPYVHEPAATA